MRVDDFRSFLLQELEKRRDKNPAYSMRAFARDLEMSPQKLGQVIRGRTGLSSSAAIHIADRIGLNGLQKDLFVALVDTRHARSKTTRQAAEEKVRILRSRTNQTELTYTEFASISTWQEWAAYLLVDLKSFKPDYDWISRTLGFPIEKVVNSYDKLFAGNFLAKDSSGMWRRTKEKISFSAKITSKEIRQLYREVLGKAETTLENVPVTERHFHVAMIALQQKNYNIIKDRIEKFCHELSEEFSVSDHSADNVYSVAVQFFPLNETKKDQK